MSRQPLSKAEFLARMAAGRAKAAKRRTDNAKALKSATNPRRDFNRRPLSAREVIAITSMASKPRRAKSAATRGIVHVARELGVILAVEYRHVVSGKSYRHEFKGGRAKLAILRDGKHLVITPVQMIRQDGQEFIGD